MSSVLSARGGLQDSAAGASVPPQCAGMPARRRLFGAVDHEALRRDIESKLRALSERDQQRWNFDFAAGTPLHGEYAWVQAHAPPAFYQGSGERRLEPLHATRTADPADEGKPVRVGAVTEARVGTPAAARAPCARSAHRKTSLVATRITDFYVRRRTAGSLKRCRSAPPKSFISLPEQTPRKRIR